MTEILQFFTPFFSSVLFNHSSLALIELSFFISILMFGTVGKLVDQKPETSFSSTGYSVSIILFLSSIYLLFNELSWWKSIINIVVSVIVFVILSELILSIINFLFAGLYNLQSSKDGRTIKRSSSVFIGAITILAVVLGVLLKNKIY